MVKLNSPTFILTYAESELLLADAAQRLGVGGSAADHFKNGVIAAITFMTPYDPLAAISDAAANTYYNANAYNAANGLQQINTQYWIHTATMLDFYEEWSNWRRTGLPALTPVNYQGNATGGIIP
ncbi:MAG: SusD/RagB family nutrient-binding outer membrane lipoprotein, partial [Sphingobacteriaceae bacterium]